MVIRRQVNPERKARHRERVKTKQEKEKRLTEIKTILTGLKLPRKFIALLGAGPFLRQAEALKYERRGREKTPEDELIISDHLVEKLLEYCDAWNIALPQNIEETEKPINFPKLTENGGTYTRRPTALLMQVLSEAPEGTSYSMRVDASQPHYTNGEYTIFNISFPEGDKIIITSSGQTIIIDMEAIHYDCYNEEISWEEVFQNENYTTVLQPNKETRQWQETVAAHLSINIDGVLFPEIASATPKKKHKKPTKPEPVATVSTTLPRSKAANAVLQLPTLTERLPQKPQSETTDTDPQDEAVVQQADRLTPESELTTAQKKEKREEIKTQILEAVANNRNWLSGYGIWKNFLQKWPIGFELAIKIAIEEAEKLEDPDCQRMQIVEVPSSYDRGEKPHYRQDVIKATVERIIKETPPIGWRTVNKIRDNVKAKIKNHVRDNVIEGAIKYEEENNPPPEEYKDKFRASGGEVTLSWYYSPEFSDRVEERVIKETPPENWKTGNAAFKILKEKYSTIKIARQTFSDKLYEKSKTGNTDLSGDFRSSGKSKNRLTPYYSPDFYNPFIEEIAKEYGAAA